MKLIPVSKCLEISNDWISYAGRMRCSIMFMLLGYDRPEWVGYVPVPLATVKTALIPFFLSNSVSLAESRLPT
jgi:hypothetical protein